MSQQTVKQLAPPLRPTDSTPEDTEQLPTFHVHPQIEKHTKNTGFVHDAIIGLADGLTVPFALTAGLSSYVDLLMV
jgi:VIT family